MQKTSIKCNETLPVESFHKTKSNNDGRHGKCKKCAYEYYRNWIKLNPDKAREYRRAWRKKHPETVRKQARKQHSKDRDKISEHNKKYCQENKPTTSAISKAFKARAKGVLIPGPCESCGFVGPVDGHHDDYSMPLKVRWLCRSCHATYHSDLRRKAQ